MRRPHCKISIGKKINFWVGYIMNKELKIMLIKARINILASRGDNQPIINKLNRQLRALEKDA